MAHSDETRPGTTDTLPPPPPPARSGGPGFLTVLLGGVLAGALGYGAAYYTNFGLFDTTALQGTQGGSEVTRQALSDQSDRLGTAESALDTQSQRIESAEGALADIGGRLSAAETAGADQSERVAAAEGALGEMTERLTQLEATAAQQSERLTQLIEALEGAAADDAAQGQEQAGQVEQGLASLRDELSGLADQIPAPVDTQALLDQANAAAEARLGEVSGTITDLQSQVESLTQRPGAEALDALSQQIASLSSRVDEQQSALQSTRSTLEETRSELESTRTSLTETQTKLTDAEAQNRAQSVTQALARIDGALAAGAPYADPLQSLTQNSDIQVPENLSRHAQDGVPTVAQLTDAFDQASGDALAAAIGAQAGDSVAERAGAFLRLATGARTPGSNDNGPDGVLSRARGLLEEGDVAGSVAALDALPRAGRQAMAQWIDRALARVEATKGFVALSQTINAS